MRRHELRPAARAPEPAQPGPSTEGRGGHGAIAELDNMAPVSMRPQLGTGHEPRKGWRGLVTGPTQE